jgi:hypothetical protein
MGGLDEDDLDSFDDFPSTARPAAAAAQQHQQSAGSKAQGGHQHQYNQGQHQQGGQAIVLDRAPAEAAEQRGPAAVEAPLAGGRRQLLHLVLEVERHPQEATVVLMNEFTVGRPC